jgi:hypothetical protein
MVGMSEVIEVGLMMWMGKDEVAVVVAVEAVVVVSVTRGGMSPIVTGAAKEENCSKGKMKQQGKALTCLHGNQGGIPKAVPDSSSQEYPSPTSWLWGLKSYEA